MALSTKAELIGQSLLSISGGVLTPDFTTRWGEAETYLCMAVNYVQTGNYWLETKAEGEKTINPLLLTTFQGIPILYDNVQMIKYSMLPKNVITLPKGRALEMMTTCGKKCFPLGQGDDALEEYYQRYKANISYQIEGTNRVNWYNLPKLIESVKAKYIVAIHDLDDTDEIILPSDGYAKVIDMVVGFLTGELKMHKDYALNANSN